MLATDVRILDGDLGPRPRVMELLIAAIEHGHPARLYTRSVADPVAIVHPLEIVPV